MGSVGSLRQGLSLLPAVPLDGEEEWAMDDTMMMGSTPSVRSSHNPQQTSAAKLSHAKLVQLQQL